MKQNFIQKCFLTLSLLFFLTLLSPLSTAKAANIIEGGKTESSKIEDYKLNLKSVTLVKGKSFQLKAYNISANAKVSFKSDNQEIASVSGEGVITANMVGNTVITATIKDDIGIINLNCEVLVGPPAFSIKITKSRVIIGLDKSDYLNVIMKPSNTVEAARFSSYDSSIASVSTGGRITAKKLGLTYIFAEIDALDSEGKNRFDDCTVIVTSPEDAPLLDSYFSDHPELDMIPSEDLTKALDEFFNVRYTPTANTSLVSSLNRYLEDKFKLADLRAIREAAAK